MKLGRRNIFLPKSPEHAALVRSNSDMAAARKARIFHEQRAKYLLERHVPRSRETISRLSRRMFLAGGAASVVATQALADTPFTSFAFPGTGQPFSRTMPARIVDVYNVKDYGAVGDSTTDDTNAIRAAFTAMWNNGSKGAIIFFPPGGYNCYGNSIDISNPVSGSNGTSGRMVGSGKNITTIFGTINNGFVLRQADGTNGLEEIAHMGIVNLSTWIASGALNVSDTSMVVHDCGFRGMINALTPFNIYNMEINDCSGTPSSDATTGYQGTLGIAGFAPFIRGWRSTTNYNVAFQLWGSNPCILTGNSIENVVIGAYLGVFTGWASSCTVAPDGSNPGSSIITVAGDLGTDPSAFVQIANGMQVFGRGLALQTWGVDPHDNSGTFITADHNTDGTLTGVGGHGTYRINGTYTISTPIPIWTRGDSQIAGIVVDGLVTEANYHILYINKTSAAVINAVGGGSTPTECVDRFGVPGYCARVGIYLLKASATKISGCTPNNNPYLASIYIDPSAVLVNVTFDSCLGQKLPDNVTGTSSSISNGSGGSGTILNVLSYVGSTIGIGMAVTVGGVSKGTVIGNHVTDNTLTGSGQTGTYRLDTSNLITGSVITIHTGADWVMPTAPSSKAGLQFVNCGATLPAGVSSGLNTLGMTFTCLPGQAGADGNVQLVEGQTFYIVDSNTATPGATAAGGGSNRVRVQWNATNWIVL